MEKQNEKTGAQQKYYEGYDSDRLDSQFSEEFETAEANRAHKEKNKKE